MDWLEVVSKVGVPIALSAAMLWMFWAAVRWAAVNVAMPIVNSHREYLLKTAEASRKAVEAVAAMQQSNDQQARALEVIKATNVASAESLNAIEKKLPGVCKMPPTTKG